MINSHETVHTVQEEKFSLREAVSWESVQWIWGHFHAFQYRSAEAVEARE